MSGRSRASMALALALATIALAACGQPSAPLPPGPQVVDLTMKEYSYDYDASGLVTGRVLFRVHNAGKEGHRLALIALSEDFPPLAEHIAGDKGVTVTPIADLPTMQPGARNVFSVGLPAGRWGMVCYYTGDDGISDSKKGMVSEFRIE